MHRSSATPLMLLLCDHRHRAAHRVRQHRESAARARRPIARWRWRCGSRSAPTRRQLIAQLLTESVLLAALGGIASMLVAHWTLGVIAALLPADRPLGDTTFAHRARTSLLFTGSAVARRPGSCSASFPALQSTRPDLVTELRNNSGKLVRRRAAPRASARRSSPRRSRSRWRCSSSAGLFIKSLMQHQPGRSRHQDRQHGDVRASRRR